MLDQICDVIKNGTVDNDKIKEEKLLIDQIIDLNEFSRE